MLLSATSTSLACGVPFTRAFPSISVSCWLSSKRFRVFCLTSEVGLLQCIQTTPWPWLTSGSRGHSLIVPECGGSGTPSPLRGLVSLAASPVHSRPSECFGGYTQPPLSSPRLQMDFVSSGCIGAPASVASHHRSLNLRLLVYFSPMYDPQSAGTDTMLQPWDGLQAYAFPPFSLLPWVLAKVWVSRGLELTLIALFWPQHHWFPDLLEIPLFCHKGGIFSRQPHFHHFHRNLSMQFPRHF